MRVYHFLPEQWALEALFKKRLKISLFGDLNDPFEHFGFEIADETKRLAWEQIIIEVEKKFGVICFSKEWSNPLLWSHYADKHKGICLGFEVPENHLKEIVYRSSQIPDREVTKFYENNSQDTEHVETRKHLFLAKYEGWRYEEEVRVFTSLEDQEDGKYFIEFSNDIVLKEIILGVRCKVDENRIKECLKDDIEVIKAKLDTQSFNVTKAN